MELITANIRVYIRKKKLNFFLKIEVEESTFLDLFDLLHDNGCKMSKTTEEVINSYQEDKLYSELYPVYSFKNCNLSKIKRVLSKNKII